MPDPTPAEILPGLYRAVLDGVDRLERTGRRSAAARIRADATRLYARSWDGPAVRRLTELHTATQRLAADRPAPARLRLRRVVRRVTHLRRTAA